MKNNGLLNSLYVEQLKNSITPDDAAQGRMATLAQTWRTRTMHDRDGLWDSFLKQALSYLEFVPPGTPAAPGVYPLYEDWSFSKCISVLTLVPPGADIDDTAVGSFYPAKLLAQLYERKLRWGILTDGATWRLYATKSSRPYEDYVELPLQRALENSDEAEYGLFERFFHKDAFVAEETDVADGADRSAGITTCRLDNDREASEEVLEEAVKAPLLAQVDEVLQYICNGFIFDTRKPGEAYNEEERAEIFESGVKLIYRCLFLFYAEARRLLPSDPAKADLYRRHSIRALCEEAHKFRWGARHDVEQYGLWRNLKSLINAVNNGDPEYGIMGYNGGLFDDEAERFLGRHRLRNDFLSRALYLLAFVEPFAGERDEEYAIPYEDLEVRHLGELYEGILESTVQLADADRIRRRTKKGVEILLASQAAGKPGDRLIKKGEVYFGESALERKQTGSYYTPESLVRFLNEKSIIQPLRELFEREYRQRFNALLEQAINGYEEGTRRGAAQSAALWVEHFVEEEVLAFKVCDPAMGSGHFLVDAATRMAGLVVALLAEVPTIERMTLPFAGAPNEWRRRITRACIYGVDLNPLAVNLAKLALWLNCFAGEHKLTFLDHHVRCGNSLVGIRSLDDLATIPERKKGRKKQNHLQGLLFDIDDLSAVLKDAGADAAAITRIDEDDTDRQKAMFSDVSASAATLRPLADLRIAYLMDATISSHDYRSLFEILASERTLDDTLNFSLPGVLEAVEGYRDRHAFFHWPLVFPDVFGPEGVGGFSATVGNPPWDMSSANPSEFFSVYYPGFRNLNRTQSLKKIDDICASNSRISDKWDLYRSTFDEQNSYFKEPSAYDHAPTGRSNLFQYFLHRSFNILDSDGHLGIVVPSGLYTDKGCYPLRKLLFDQSQVEFLYCFENRWPAVFSAVDSRFKFVTFGTKKSGKTTEFKCAFMEHDPERLPVIDAEAMTMSTRIIKKTSPSTGSLMEFNNRADLDIANRLYDDHLLLGDTSKRHWNVEFSIEFMSNTDAWRFDGVPKGVPVYGGRNIRQFDDQLSESTKFIPLANLQDEYSSQPERLREFRLVFRDIARSTDERTCITAILSPPSACLETARLIHVDIPGQVEEHCSEYLVLLYLSAMLNSFCVDFLLRKMVTAHLSQHIMARVPAPRISVASAIPGMQLVSRCARLVCTRHSYSELWDRLHCRGWQGPDFWYPSAVPIDAYGPAHEQEIRRRLRDEAAHLTPEWGPHCGVHDRLPDRRDTGDRAQLRAEIDAYVAHLYGLSRDDFAYILDTFPVLKRKEIKAFGEFMSKRKCLEEYDRIGKIMGAEG